MKKPVIGITPSHNTDNDDISARPTYLRAIEAAGGLSILLPLEVSGEAGVGNLPRSPDH